MPEPMPETTLRPLAYHIVRYTPNLVRDEWVNIGVLLLDPTSGRVLRRLMDYKLHVEFLCADARKLIGEVDDKEQINAHSPNAVHPLLKSREKHDRLLL